MKNYKIILFLSSLLLSACALRASFVSQLDPSYAPKKSDPIALLLPDNSSIQDRQVYPVVKEELVKAGFKLVEPNQATWILGMGTHQDTYFSGIQTMAFSYNNVAVGSSNAEYTSRIIIYFWLFPAESFHSGKRMAIWGGFESVRPSSFREHPADYVRALIELYGKNFYDESERLSKVKRDVDSE